MVYNQLLPTVFCTKGCLFFYTPQGTRGVLLMANDNEMVGDAFFVLYPLRGRPLCSFTARRFTQYTERVSEA